MTWKGRPRNRNKLIGHTDKVTSVAFAPKGDKVLSGGWDATVRLWDVATGLQIRQFIGHSDWVQAVAISPDAKLAVTGSGGGMVGNAYIGKGDCSVRLWDVETAEELKKFTGDWGGISCAGFLPDGRHIFFAEWASRKPNPSFHVWDTTNGWAVARWTDPAGPSVVAAAVSSDGTHALVGRAFNAGPKAPLLRLPELGPGKSRRRPALPAGAKQFTNTLGMEFALVPKGKSWLGGGNGKPGDKEVEIPARLLPGRVRGDAGGVGEGDGEQPEPIQVRPGVAKEDQKRFPVENVSWDDCQLFIKKRERAGEEAGWDVSAADGGGMGICVSGRTDDGQG